MTDPIDSTGFLSTYRFICFPYSSFFLSTWFMFSLIYYIFRFILFYFFFALVVLVADTKLVLWTFSIDQMLWVRLMWTLLVSAESWNLHVNVRFLCQLHLLPGMVIEYKALQVGRFSTKAIPISSAASIFVIDTRLEVTNEQVTAFIN